MFDPNLVQNDFLYQYGGSKYITGVVAIRARELKG